MGLYDNIKSGAGAISGAAINLPSFIPVGVGLNTSALTALLPQNQQSSWQNGILNKNSNINKNYSEFNAQNGFDSSKAISQDIQSRYKPEIIEENITEYLPNQRGYYSNLKQTPLQKPKSISPNGSPSGIVSDAVKTPEQQLDAGMQKLKSEQLANGSTMTAGQKATAFMSGAGGVAINAAAGLVGSALNTVGSMVGQYADRPEAQQLDETQEAVRSGIYSAVSAVPVWGPLISAGLQMTDGLGKLIGGQMSNISKDAAEDAGLNRGLNNVVATIPGVGSMLGLFTKKTDEFKFDRSRVDNISSAYDMSTFDSADDLSGGKFLGQRDKVNNFIAEQNRKKDLMTGISDTQKLRKMGASAMAAAHAQRNLIRYGGITGQQFAIGKKGMKMPNLDWAKRLLTKFQSGGKTEEKKEKVYKGRSIEELKAYADSVNPRFIQRANDTNIPYITWTENGKTLNGTHLLAAEYGPEGENGPVYVYPQIQEIDGKLVKLPDKWVALDAALRNGNVVPFDNLEEAIYFTEHYKDIYPAFQKFQKGGKLGLDTNVIVEGSYHAHKNHLDEVNPELSDMTPKGIPVAVTDENGEKQQIAEIERKELILTKELTDKIEALYKDGSEEAMIEAGMLFADELFNNTEDNTGEVLNENN